jgi:two-component system nitrogen regulation sensor histidine kinase GlnL
MARAIGEVLEAILAGVVVADREGRIEQLNSVACRMLEHSSESVRGRPVEELVNAQHAVARLARMVLTDSVAVSEISQSIERRQGEDVQVDVAASPLFDEGELDGVLIFLRDRSTHRRLEQLEAERERFDAFGRIAAGLAHEIKNPLGGIRGAGELLARRSSDDKGRQTAELVVRESVRIAALVDDFMVFARGEQLREEPVNVHRVLDQVLDLLSHDPVSEGCRVVRAYDPSIPEMQADPNRLNQVFANLARNAFQAMAPGGGQLTITTRMTLDHRISLSVGRPAPTLAIWFQDTGGGMDEEELRRATTPFYTTRAGGTGLGLAVAEYWVAQHLGSLHLESEKGGGTLVRVTLPLRRTA